ncbi:MAG: GNAT family N-acetyltransferase [Schleiferiaceae bacterium]|jgi:ElaA protein|nr:GNAT family N-acetyltransferase [Schleiferiaceae bacterium]
MFQLFAAMELRFEVKTFDELTKEELYDLLQLRSEVFVVEQNCPYQDLDGKDTIAFHVLGTLDGKIMAYTRLFAPGKYYKETSIGRVVTSPSIRMEGAGKSIMAFSLEKAKALFKANIRIMAQCYLTKFYEDFGFVQEGQEFLEDGIPHIEMILKG